MTIICRSTTITDVMLGKGNNLYKFDLKLEISAKTILEASHIYYISFVYSTNSILSISIGAVENLIIELGTL